MLKPKKKLAKKELKQDALITTYARVSGFYETYRRIIGIVGVSVAVLVLAVIVYNKNRSADEEKASTELGKVLAYFDNGQYSLAMDGIPESNIQGLKAIVESYSGTRSGELARFYLGSAHYELGNHREALEHLEEFSPSGDVLVTARLAGIAACHEALKQYAEAAEGFEAASNVSPDEVSAPENTYHAARNYALAGNKEKALQLYTRLKKDFPATPLGREADRYIAGLSI